MDREIVWMLKFHFITNFTGEIILLYKRRVRFKIIHLNTKKLFIGYVSEPKHILDIIINSYHLLADSALIWLKSDFILVLNTVLLIFLYNLDKN